MEKENYYEYKASTAELAIKNGLAELGLVEDNADIEIVAKGGIFSKAVVRITPKKAEQIEAEPIEEIIAVDSANSEEQGAEEIFDTEEKGKSFVQLKAIKEKGKQLLEEIASFMGANVTIEGKVHEDEICLYIGGDDAKMFIGYKGEVLEATQTFISHLLNKDVSDSDDRTRIVIDADFYRERRKKTLTALAKKLAKQAFNQHREISLEPMNSYERRIIHSALSNSDEASTRSDGEGKSRHIVIVPKNGVMSYGNSGDFKKKGPQKTKSFGYNKRRF